MILEGLLAGRTQEIMYRLLDSHNQTWSDIFELDRTILKLPACMVTSDKLDVSPHLRMLRCLISAVSEDLDTNAVLVIQGPGLTSQVHQVRASVAAPP